MKVIRAGSGLGDSFYLRSIAAEFLRLGEEIVVRSNYPEAFLGLKIKVEPFDRFGVHVVAHYTLRKTTLGTNQFQDMCIAANLGPGVQLSIEWSVRNRALIDGLLADANGRKIIIVHGGRTPMERKDQFGAELLPDRAAFDAALEMLTGCFLVRIGKGAQLYPLRCDVDLNGSTSVSDLLDLASVADAFVAQVSFCIPLAEMFDRPLLCVWASAGMSPARHHYISSITPQKVLSKPTSKFVVDDWPLERVQSEVTSFKKAVSKK